MMTEAETVERIAADCPRCIHWLVLGTNTDQMAIGTITIKCRWMPSEKNKCTRCGDEGPTLKTQYRRRGKWEEIPGIDLCQKCLDNLPDTPPENVEGRDGANGSRSGGAASRRSLP